jgi:hypothetical protein
LSKHLVMLVHLFSLVTEISKYFFERQDAKKERVADLLDIIGGDLCTVADILSKGEYPHDYCAKLTAYGEEFYNLTKHVFKEKSQETLRESLMQALLVERLYSEREDKQTINYLRALCGTFKAHADILRAE